MNRNGVAYPSQKTIAKGIRATMKTVQRHVELAERHGWLVIELAGRKKQGWRHYAYRACVPDSLKLGERHEEVSDHVRADLDEFRPLRRGDKLKSPPFTKRGDKPKSPPSDFLNPAIQRRGDNSDAIVETSALTRGDTSSPNVATHECRTNSRSETPAPKSHAQEEAHHAQSRAVRPRAASGLSETQAKPEISDEQLAEKATRLQQLGYSVAEIERQLSIWRDVTCARIGICLRH